MRETIVGAAILLQVFPYQLGCVHCAGVVLSAGFLCMDDGGLTRYSGVMVLIIYGNSEIGAHVRSNLRLKHLIRPRAFTSIIRKGLFSYIFLPILIMMVYGGGVHNVAIRIKNIFLVSSTFTVFRCGVLFYRSM